MEQLEMFLNHLDLYDYVLEHVNYEDGRVQIVVDLKKANFKVLYVTDGVENYFEQLIIADKDEPMPYALFYADSNSNDFIYFVNSLFDDSLIIIMSRMVLGRIVLYNSRFLRSRYKLEFLPDREQLVINICFDGTCNTR
ncbi:hypothetical protein SFV1gp60 [Sulfolobus filamentous virus 1]|uniref:Uncharacterized protein n=2 Tax=Alphalipothrixvirus beppuense TaxID=2734584 RepID=A0A346LU99_SUFV1|nr:hypothetical protein HOT91_gp60 [Sulfolobus filamentous virus 1]AXQ00142.1 hypothetical protein SFV1gp60 [Sulfolobus filamentous virus 1]AZI75762.1 hypothetical protein SBFV1_gp61 [Sulfolobales Beppu filamentous phage 1]